MKTGCSPTQASFDHQWEEWFAVLTFMKACYNNDLADSLVAVLVMGSAQQAEKRHLKVHSSVEEEAASIRYRANQAVALEKMGIAWEHPALEREESYYSDQKRTFEELKLVAKRKNVALKHNFLSGRKTSMAPHSAL